MSHAFPSLLTAALAASPDNDLGRLEPLLRMGVAQQALGDLTLADLRTLLASSLEAVGARPGDQEHLEHAVRLFISVAAGR